MTDEVSSVGQEAGKLKVQELQETSNRCEVDVLVLPSVATAGQLLNSESTSGKKSNQGKSNTAPQATAKVEELLLFDPP